jgi:hypothetical protein
MTKGRDVRCVHGEEDGQKRGKEEMQSKLRRKGLLR